jgi:hypothetical protein
VSNAEVWPFLFSGAKGKTSFENKQMMCQAICYISYSLLGIEAGDIVGMFDPPEYGEEDDSPMILSPDLKDFTESVVEIITHLKGKLFRPLSQAMGQECPKVLKYLENSLAPRKITSSTE